MFHIICLETNEPYKLSEEIVTFTDGKDAASLAHALTLETGKKHQPRRIIDNVNWRERELARFDSGEYVVPDWRIKYSLVLEQYGLDDKDHFLHVSKRNPAMIAVTTDELKGQADIQTPVRVGAYLCHFCPNLPSEIIKEIALHHSTTYVPIVLKIAKTEREIVYVYEDGPSSCMSKPACAYESHIHPVAVYGDSDLQLAYLTDDYERITARALIWPEKMRYGRIYGDEERLRHALQNAGYKSGDFEGARLRHIECQNNGVAIMPYLDGIQNVRQSGEWLIIDDDGDYCADQTTGLIEECERYTCDNCGDRANDIYSVYVARNRSEDFCPHCYENNTFICQGTEQLVSCQEEVTVEGESYSQWYASDNFNYCDVSDTYTSEEIVEVTYILACGGSTWSQNCKESILADKAIECRISGDYYDINLAVTDPWADLPRSMLVYPTDVPAWYIGDIDFVDWRQRKMEFAYDWSRTHVSLVA